MSIHRVHEAKSTYGLPIGQRVSAALLDELVTPGQRFAPELDIHSLVVQRCGYRRHLKALSATLAASRMR
jgi:hypothetical protein